ncbi:hypothetical protein OHV52_18285 [Acinetobacter baumannii]|uniref:hypothetical protein n=1 Tax=Acinetobacter baumannii TaxID=470 RepID=UPI0010A8E17E|nr:hypothetical protein [Acinetobacter baumannii]MDC4527804.1 hypothetical protein [Acinetobacter baumannii]THV22578.1 hypothetical protein FAU76_00095 [Acinetobacter baumannii]
MIDYDIFYRENLDINEIKELLSIDIFISAFNDSERVKRVFNEINAEKKIWFIQKEYHFDENIILDLPNKITVDSCDESIQVEEIIKEIGAELEGKNIYIDCTGFMRHTLVFLIIRLGAKGCKNINIIYSEPSSYIDNDATRFSELCDEVRAIKGTSRSKIGPKEAVLMSIGYDADLMSQMLNKYEGVKLYPLFSFPSLSADMFQHSIIKSSNIQFSSKGQLANYRNFAPAHDPFSTAKEISKIIKRIANDNIYNIYLVPLSTKAQVIGHTYFWWKEREKLREDKININLTLPISSSYQSKTSHGIGRVWKYTLEM